jgi:hypothetical protein
MDNETYLKAHQKFLLRLKAINLIAESEALGFVLTIEQKPLVPLAMGNYISDVSIREARK